MEYIRSLPDNDRTMGYRLGLSHHILLSHQCGILGCNSSHDGLDNLDRLDAYEQVPEVDGPLHTTPG